MATNCSTPGCSGYDVEPEALADEDYLRAVDVRLHCLELTLRHMADTLVPAGLLAFAHDAAEFVLYGGAADEDAAHEPEECELPGERPLS